jgi:hypothetical protein
VVGGKSRVHLFYQCLGIIFSHSTTKYYKIKQTNTQQVYSGSQKNHHYQGFLSQGRITWHDSFHASAVLELGHQR